MKTLILTTLALSAAPAGACTVFSEINEWSCSPNYFATQLQNIGATPTADPTSADIAIGYYHRRDEGPKGYTVRTMLGAFNQREAGTELNSVEMGHYYVKYRQEQYQQQQQQQQQGSYRCKEKEYRREQNALSQLLPLIQQACRSFPRR